jgi:hypothetical protein
MNAAVPSPQASAAPLVPSPIKVDLGDKQTCLSHFCYAAPKVIFIFGSKIIFGFQDVLVAEHNSDKNYFCIAMRAQTQLDVSIAVCSADIESRFGYTLVQAVQAKRPIL